MQPFKYPSFYCMLAELAILLLQPPEYFFLSKIIFFFSRVGKKAMAEHVDTDIAAHTLMAVLFAFYFLKFGSLRKQRGSATKHDRSR